MSIKELSQSILDASKEVIELSELKVSMQIVPGSEKKLMPLAKKAGVRLQKPKPGDDEAHVVGDKKSLKKFMMARGMSADDIEDSHPELKEESDPRKERIKQKRAKINQQIDAIREKIKRIEAQEKTANTEQGAILSVKRVGMYHDIGDLQDKLDDMKESKKLDPVGKADADIDNDGDTDSSDEYLHKRRNAIKQAMKKEGNKFTLALSQAKEKGEKSFVCAGRKYDVQEVEELEKDPKKKDIKEKDEKKSIYQVRKDMQKSVKDANQKLKDAEQRKKDRIRKMQDDESGKSINKEELVSDLLPILEKYDIKLISEIIGNVRIPDAGQDSSGIRKAVGKDGGPDKKDSGMDNKEKSGYNALLSIAKKLNKAYNDEATAPNEDAEERAIDQVQKFRAEFNSKAKFYKDATVSKAKADAKKAVPPKEKNFG
jgi:hypothetical protein